MGTDRRTFIASLVGAAASLPQTGIARTIRTTFSISLRGYALPTTDQLAWADLELGMFVHFAPNTWQDREQDDLSTPLSAIDPTLLNTDQWAATAVELGAKYIVFVAKHSGGFCMWQTRTTDYGIRNTPWRNGDGDVLADVSASCRKFGLKLGVYVSPRDATFGAGIGGLCKTPEKQRIYNAVYREQLTQVLSRYGEMVEVWFDGSNVIPVGDILNKDAPHAMIFQGPHATIRWAGNEDGFVPYPAWNAVSAAAAKTGIATAVNGTPNGTVWLPNEVDVSIRRPHWFWSTTNQRDLLSLNSLLEIYYRSIGRGAQLLLNIPPDRTGLLPNTDRASAREFGGEIRRRFGKSVAECSGRGSMVTLPLSPAMRVDTAVLEEVCALGQRVRRYKLEGRSGGAWIKIGSGTAIGHKRIQPFAPAVFDAVRLVIGESAGQSEIRRFAVFNTGATPPLDWNASATAQAYDEVGSWKDHKFRVDISDNIAAATQYRLRFVPQGGWTGCRQKISRAALLLDGASEPRLIQPWAESADVLILTLPSFGQQVVVEGVVNCAESGAILLQRY